MRLLALGLALLVGGCTVQFPINLPGSQQVQPAPDLSIPLVGLAPQAQKQPCVPGHSPDQDKKLADAMVQLPADSIILLYLAEYHDIRAVSQLCPKATK